jgi:hypothetical protein
MANWAREYLAANPELAGRPVERHQFGMTFQRPDGTFEGHFVGTPAHYEVAPGVWEPIDTALIDHGDHISGTGTKTRLQSDGTAQIGGGTFSQRTTRVGIFRPSTQSIVVAVNVPGRSIQDDSLVAGGNVGGAHWEHRLQLHETGLRELWTLDSLPTIPGVQAGDWLVLETVIGGKTYPDGWVDTVWDQDGHHFDLPRAWDADRQEIPARRYARTVAGVQYLFTGIAVTHLAGAAYPVTIDPDYVDYVADGHVKGANAVYATAHTTGTGYIMTGNSMNVGQSYNGVTYFCNRVALKFDTSAITAGAVVTRAYMKLTCIYDPSTVDFNVSIRRYNWAANDPIGAGNMAAWFTAALAAAVEANNWRNTAGIAINTQYPSGDLLTTWVNKVGPTYYALLSDREAAGFLTPTVGNDEYITLATQEHETVVYRPVLTVEWYTTVTITSPSPDGTLITTTTPTFTWTMAGFTQASYRVAIFDNAAATNLVYDSGIVASAVMSHTMPGGPLFSGMTYYLKVYAVLDSGGTAITPAARSFLTSFALPDLTGVIGDTVGADDCGGDSEGLPGGRIRWTAPVLGAVTFTEYDILRREVGDTVWVRIAIITDWATTTYIDYTRPAGTTYEYAVVWQGVNGPPMISSPTYIVPITLSFPWTFIHDKDNSALFLRFFNYEPTARRNQDVNYEKTWGRPAPTAFIGEADSRVFSIPGLIEALATGVQWDGVSALLDAQVGLGRTFVLRLGRAQMAAYVQIDPGAQRKMSQKSNSVDISLTEVFVQEAV